MSVAAPEKPKPVAEKRSGERVYERRVLFATAEIRASADGKMLTGYAAKYNTYSRDLGGFVEKIAPGAFAPTLNADKADPEWDVVAVYNHKRELVLGRVYNSGTLRLSSDDVGLKFEIDLPDTTTGRDVRELVKRGDIYGCSFRFYLYGENSENWAEVKQADGTTRWERTLLSVVIDDVCPVTDPAYLKTSVEVRCKPPGTKAEQRDGADAEGAAPSATPPEAEKAKADADAAAAKALTDAQIELERDEAALALA